MIKGRKVGPMLYRRVRRLWVHEDLHTEAKEVLAASGCDVPAEGEGGDLERAEAFFASMWMGMNGSGGTNLHNCHICVRWTPGGGAGGRRYANAADEVRSWRKRMRSTTILRRCAVEILGRIEDESGVAIYVDSPYISKGFAYTHDDTARPASVDDAEWTEAVAWGREFLADTDLEDRKLTAERVAWHRCLAARNGRFKKARVVVSYYPHPLLDELYPADRWTRVTQEVSKALAAQGQRSANDVKATELLLINGPSYTQKREEQMGVWG